MLYRLAPENPFPAAVDDSVAVYKELLKTYKPEHIVIYGTSAGAILTAEVAVKLKQLGLPLPAALGIFSGMGDFARNGDSHRALRPARLFRPSRPARHPARTTPITWAQPTPKTLCSRPSTPTCTACRPRFLSPAPATCCSAAPSTCTALTYMPALTRAW